MPTRKLQGEYEKRCGYYYEFDTEADILGEGGMGRVYLGKKIEANGTLTAVAIKAMFEGLPEHVIERAKREASIQLHNDNLVQMFGFIETIDKDALGTEVTHFHVISEYLEGVMLADVIEGKLEDRKGIVQPYVGEFYKRFIHEKEKTATEIIKNILSGVMALHDAGFIHRDIDPTNIMLTTDGKIKLIDFGIAKQLTRLSTVDKGLTSSGQFLGKAGYAAPELVLGDIRHQNFSSDVYAIGILYFQLIAGHLPFEGTAYEMLEAQLHKKIPLKTITSRPIRKIIKKATEKRQANRYATSAQFRAAIDNTVYPESWAVPFLKIGCAALAAGLLALGILNYHPNDTESETAIPSTEAVYQRYLAQLTSYDPDSLAIGLKGMEQLANEGYPEAMYQLAYTYVWAPNDTVSLARKKYLHLEVTPEGLLVSHEKNEEAVTWLKKTIQATDSTHYMALYWLGYYYLNGKVVAEDLPTATRIFQKSREYAVQAKDIACVQKIDEVLNAIINLEKEI